MAALVQSFPQQSGSAIMLQSRPASASGILQNTAQSQVHQYSQGSANVHRNSYHNLGGGSAGSNTYRGHTSSMAPIAPYAFTSTPALTNPRQQYRTASAPTVPTVSSGHLGGRPSRYPAPASVSTTTSSSSSNLSGSSASDGTSSSGGAVAAQAWETTLTRPLPTVITSTPSFNPASTGPSTPTKAAPDRYRRPAHRRADTVPTLPSQPPVHQQGQATHILAPNFSSGNTLPNGSRGATDDIYIQRHAKEDRSRRRSIHTVEGFNKDSQKLEVFGQQGQLRNDPYQKPSYPIIRPSSSPGRTEQYESNRTARHSEPRAPGPKRDSSVITAGINPASSTVAGSGSLKHDQPQVVNIPARGSSSDATKRTANPSPLSKPTMSTESAVTKDTFASAVTAALSTPEKTNVSRPQSPAAKQLAALNAKGGKKPSRLRRAFSFGSAAELRKASAETNPNHTEDAARLQTYQDENEAEQARIARKQEEGGIGSGIYSGQGNFFSGSTDNLSISSTASSASIMIRKMGKGMKKSTRSLVGLFRPKSVIGVPAADSAVPQVSTAEVSMVNVEADRPQSNGNISIRDQSGITSRPEPDTNSLNVGPINLGRASGSTDDVSIGSDSAHRRSIRGGDKERAEVLAAVKKGILKRSGTDSGSSSPVALPVDHKTPNFGLPQIPSVDDSPPSSAPSTPNSDVHGHRRTESVTLNGEDYFMSALRFNGTVSKSSPATPAAKRNISWKNAANYHDTWASTEYDRRGEIATCNRLTPMLAQQIKEELNTFKMEMEVHETSKIYTHFF
ncbi:bud neck involved protein [Pseudogymnoascus australis]